jgi:pimeloyl-ACP methyl ester carboxylesterase
MSRHFHYHSIKAYSGSYVYLSENPQTNTALIFVHGWGGNSRDTWADFQSIFRLDSAPFWDLTDLYFYDYESVNRHLEDNALQLAKFIEKIYPQPSAELVSDEDFWARNIVSLVGETPRKYSSLLLAGHSEGAVLIRMVVRDTAAEILKNISERISKAEFSVATADVRLFAPASGGKKLGGLLGLISRLPGLGSGLSFSRANNDLEAGSEVLKQLREHTEAFQQHAVLGKLRALRARCLFGRKEDVVTPLKYLFDDVEFEESKNHVSVCKPSFKYLRPLRFLTDAAKRTTA